MKKNKTIYICFPLIGILSVLTFSNINNDLIKVEAYTASKIPTTINLNDCSEEEIRNYFSEVEDLSGNQLLIKLKQILSRDQKYYKYDSGLSIWQIYEISDRDWEKSPASEITYGTYNPDTNTITNYEYGTNSNYKNNPYIHALYHNRDVDNQSKAWGNHTQSEWGLNREHVWPSSQGFQTDAGKSEIGSGVWGDPMHLMAGNGRVNQTDHNNNFYGYVDKSKSYSGPFESNPSKYANLKGNYAGTSLTIGDGKVFEPQDSDKGDIARAVFYVAARYNDIAGDDNNINYENPNLRLVQDSHNTSSYCSSKNEIGKLGVISDLLQWNRLDPPDEFEIHRNNLLYRNFTNNRNPFIDFPEWAEAIWGTANNGNYNPEITRTASASKDEINGGAYIDVDNGYALINKETKARVVSNNYYDVSWSISDSLVASINKNNSKTNEDIVITGLNQGSTTLNANVKIDENKNINLVYSLNVYKIEPPKPSEEILITSLSLNKESLNLKINETYQLEAIINPENASKFEFYWGSSNEDVASVNSEGLVTAKGNGKCIITLFDAKSSLVAECEINVSFIVAQCGGNISSTNIILFITALGGIILLLIKKKEFFKIL